MTDNVAQEPAKVLPDMETLHERHYGLTEAVARVLAEAAAVCLDRHHMPPAAFLITHGEQAEGREVRWAPANARARGAWANSIDRTEAGAYAMAIAAVESMLGLMVVSRAPAKSGADYRIGSGWPVDEHGELDLEPARRLEVSGMDRGSQADLHARLSGKAKQIVKGGDGPGCAVVVAFEMKRIALREV